jgi:hypothetical protein
MDITARPGSSCSTRAFIVPVYGTTKPTVREKSQRPAALPLNLFHLDNTGCSREVTIALLL